MNDNTLSISVTINAPAEDVWSLYIEQRQGDEQKQFHSRSGYFQSDHQGKLVAGQVIHAKIGPLPVTISTDQVEKAEPPLEGLTSTARITFLGKEGKLFSHWRRDDKHYRLQTQFELNHPWLTDTEKTTVGCMAIDIDSCVLVYTRQSEMTFCLIPRWLKQLMDKDRMARTGTANVAEKYLQSIKEKAEQRFPRSIDRGTGTYNWPDYLQSHLDR